MPLYEAQRTVDGITAKLWLSTNRIVGKKIDFISWNLLTAIAEDIFRVALVVIKDPRVLAFRQCLIPVQVIH